MLMLKQSEATAARRRVPIYLVDATDGVTPETGLTFSGSDVQLSKNGAAFASFAGTMTEVAAGLYHYEATAGELDTLGFLAVKVVKTGVRTFVGMAQVVAVNVYDAAALGLTNLDAAVTTRAAAAQLPGALVGGRVDASVGAMAANVITAAAAATDFGQEIADAVLDRPISGHTTAGTVGELLDVPTGAVVSDGGNTALTFKTNRSEAVTDFWKDAILVFRTGVLAGQVKKIAAYNGSTKFITLSGAFTSAPSAGDTFFILNK